MSTGVPKAIVSRWDAQSLNSTFDGGLYGNKTPQEIAFPYVVFTLISSVPVRWTSHSEIRSEVYEFSIWYKEEDDVDPIERIGELMDALKAAFDFAPLSIAVAGSELLEMRRQSEFYEEDDDEIWHAPITYNARRRVPANYSPA